MTATNVIKTDHVQMLDNIERTARQEDAATWIGRLLKYSKGDYLAQPLDGGDKWVEIDPGTRLTVAVDTYEIGWERWFKGELTAQHVGFVRDGYVRQEREELGDADASAWPL